MDYASEVADTSATYTEAKDEPRSGETSSGGPPDTSEKQLVARVLREIKKDKEKHKDAFKRMRSNMYVSRWGREESWGKDKYTANIIGRHIRTKTAALYAKNPKAVARRRETLDFTVWDETQESLMVALQTIQLGTQMMSTTAMPSVMPGEMPPEPVPGFAQAQAILQDFQQGSLRRKQLKQFGKTLEIVFSYSLSQQKPLVFKTAMKQLVRRACTTGVGYIELDYQRIGGPRPALQQQVDDYNSRLEHLQKLAQEAAEGEIEEIDAEMAELQAGLAALQNEEEVVVDEGLIFDFPASTKVIPDRLCKHLVGFVGARHITIEYAHKKEEVERMFGVELGDEYTPYLESGEKQNAYTTGDGDMDERQGELFRDKHQTGEDMICWYKQFDKTSGLVYYVAEGHSKFLRQPAPPTVYVENFWPVFALTFNESESEKELFPLSDVELLLDMQRDYNRNRQGKREHRRAARPRWGYSNGALDDQDIEQLRKSEPFDAIGLNIDPNSSLEKTLQAIPVPGVDPNLYDNNEVFEDMQLVAGTQAARLGGLSSGATATETAISANSSASDDSSCVDDLDAFLTAVARASGQILMRELSEERVKRIAGVGAVWIPQTLTDICEEVALEVEAGSTGKPNQAVEVKNWQAMLPSLLQIPGIKPEWLGRETLRRLDDRMDLTEALVSGLPSIVAQNAMTQAMPSDPANTPDRQGGEGQNNAPAAPGGPSGTDAPMGDNKGAPLQLQNDPAMTMN